MSTHAHEQARERDARLLDLEKKNSQLNQRNSELSLMLDKVLVLVFRG